jgi:hypothetical protein
MPSITYYNSFKGDLQKGLIDLDTDTIKLMLTTSSYTPNKKTHTRRSDVTNEVTGDGYTAGGLTLQSVVVTVDNTNDRAFWIANDLSFNPVTITGARIGVIYKSRGGAAANDELIGWVNFDTDRSPSNGPLTIQWDTVTGIGYLQ